MSLRDVKSVAKQMGATLEHVDHRVRYILIKAPEGFVWKYDDLHTLVDTHYSNSSGKLNYPKLIKRIKLGLNKCGHCKPTKHIIAERKKADHKEVTNETVVEYTPHGSVKPMILVAGNLAPWAYRRLEMFPDLLKLLDRIRMGVPIGHYHGNLRGCLACDIDTAIDKHERNT